MTDASTIQVIIESAAGIAVVFGIFLVLFTLFSGAFHNDVDTRRDKPSRRFPK